MIRFCIVATTRSGTSYLATALTGCPTVICHGEIFHSRVREHISREHVARLDLELRERDPKAFVESVYALKPDMHAAGFKIFRGHNDIALSHILADNGIKKIVLQRENVLASYSSLLIAVKTGHWQGRPRREEPPPEDPGSIEPEQCEPEQCEPENREPIDPRVTFDRTDFMSYWNWERQTYDYYRGSIAAAKGVCLNIDYQTLTSGDFSSIEQFLDLPTGYPWPTDIRKLNTPYILDRFYNPDDVHEFARERKIEHWLQE